MVQPDDLTPYLISDAERADWKERISQARTGLFNPPALEESAVVPGAVGGTNWGNTAANPAKGIVYLLNQDFPSFYKLQERRDRKVAGGLGRFGPPDPETAQARRGGIQGTLRHVPWRGSRRARRPAPSLITAGSQITGAHFRRIINYGNGRMPPLPHVTDEQAGDILAYLGGGGRTRRPGEIPAGPTPSGPGRRQRRHPAPAVAGTPPDAMQDYPEGVERARAALFHGLRTGVSLSTGAAVVADHRL